MTRYPLSDHYDGRRFFNPGVDSDKSLREFLKWVGANQRKPWPKHVQNRSFPPPPEGAEPGTIITTFIGQSTFLVQLPGCNLLTDPIFSEVASPFASAGPRRVRAPGVGMEHLPPIDLVLLSHNHYDHLDLPSLRELQARWRPRIVTALGVGAYLKSKGIENEEEYDWWQTVELGGDVRVHFVPAQHWSRRGAFDRRRTLWGGHVVESPSGRVFFAGDTGYGRHFSEIRRRLGSPDIALLPIGAYEARWFMQLQHMNPDDAVRAHLDLGAALSIGMHFGTFQLTDEAIDVPLRDLEVARQAHGVSPADFVVPEFGASIRWNRSEQGLGSRVGGRR